MEYKDTGGTPPNEDHVVLPGTGKLVNRFEFLRGAAMFTLGGTLFAACGGDSHPSSSAQAGHTGVKRGGTLMIGYDRDVSRVDFVATTFGDASLDALYEPLLGRDPKGKILPRLAESWQVSADGRTWTFKLRDGLKFHSGAPVTAETVADNYNLFRKKGQVAVFWNPVTSVKAADPQTLVITTKTAYRDLVNVISTVFAGIGSVELRNKLGTKYGAEDADGTGAFKFTSYKPGIETVVTRWDGYPGPGAKYFQNQGPAYLDSIKWVPIIDIGQRANEITTGAVKMVKNPAPQDIQTLKANPDLIVSSIDSPFRNYFLQLNQLKPELGFDDPRVRQAISTAIDRQTLVKSIFFDQAVPTYGPAPSSYEFYEKGVEKFNQYDPDAAGRLLDAAGWTLSSGKVRAKDGKPLSFTLWSNSATQTEIKAAEQAISQMLAKVGIEMKLKVASSPTEFFGKFADADAFDFNWAWSEPTDIVILLDEVFPDAKHTGIESTPQVADAIKAWRAAGTADALRAAAGQYQLAHAEFLPQIPILTAYDVYVYEKSVRGFVPPKTTFNPVYNDTWLDV